MMELVELSKRAGKELAGGGKALFCLREVHRLFKARYEQIDLFCSYNAAERFHEGMQLLGAGDLVDFVYCMGKGAGMCTQRICDKDGMPFEPEFTCQVQGDRQAADCQ